MKNDSYHAVVKEYRRRAPTYDLAGRRFLSFCRGVAMETLAPSGGERILDAGCGTAELSEEIVRKVGENGEVVGIDLSKDMLNIARGRLAGYNKVILIKGNLESISYQDNYFDGVVNVNVMHYLYKPAQVLKEFYRLLKPGGRLVLVGFCTDYLFFALVEKIWRVFIPSHARAYSLKELSQRLKEAGFKSVTGRRLKIGWFWRAMVVEGRKKRNDGFPGR